MSINIVCLMLNSYEKELPHPVITFRSFHMLEFWGTFGFNVVQVLAVVYAPKPLDELYCSPLILKLVILTGIASTFTSALLATISIEEFETYSHELEYINELTMTLVDLVLLISLLRNMQGPISERKKVGTVGSTFIVLVALCIATTQLCIYNLFRWDRGESKGERLAHYFEFTFEIMSAGITFWFTMDNRAVSDALVDKLIAKEDDRIE